LSREIKTLCPYCGVGCGLLVSSDGVRISKVRGDPKHPANFGKLCPKGASVAQTVDVTTRLRSAFISDREGEAPSEPSSIQFSPACGFAPRIARSLALRYANT
jgi:anaerobic selenocysteine-containing dehydrogenase